MFDDDGYDADNNAVTTAGWGNTDGSGGQAFPNKPQEVGVQVVPHATCNGGGSYSGAIDEATMVCAASSGKDSCQGDSGGPLFAPHRTDADKYVLVGVVSWGYGCALSRYPGVYARVSNFRSWLLAKNPAFSTYFASASAPTTGPKNSVTK